MEFISDLFVQRQNCNGNIKECLKSSSLLECHLLHLIHSKEQGIRSKEQGARSKEQGARSKEQGARSKEQGARS